MAPEWLILLLIGASVASACAGVVPARRPVPAGPAAGPGPTGHLLELSNRALVRLGHLRWARRLVRVQALRRRLELAGSRAVFEAVVGTEIALALSSGLCILALALLFPPAIALSPAVVVGTARAFELALTRHARRRQERMAGTVPDLVELLVATTDAGLSPGVALRRTAPILHGPLGDELRRAVSEVELGVPWQRAIERMVARTDLPSLRALAVALARSHELGTVLGSTLRRVAEDLRRERRTRAEEAARKAPIKMLFPLVFLILPAFLLLTVGPVVLATIRSLQ